jgi:hypothetical protein
MFSSVAARKMRMAISPRLAAMSLRIGRQPGLAGGGVTSAVPPDEADENERRSRPKPPTELRRMVLGQPDEAAHFPRDLVAGSVEFLNLRSENFHYDFDEAPS